MGRALQADYVLVGEVQNVPYLILEMNLVMRETKSGHMVRGLSVEVRSKTDRSWGWGMRFILSRPFLALRMISVGFLMHPDHWSHGVCKL